MSQEEIDPALRSFADHARQLDSRIRAVSFHPGARRPVMTVEIENAPREVIRHLYVQLAAYHLQCRLDCDVMVASSHGLRLVKRGHG